MTDYNLIKQLSEAQSSTSGTSLVTLYVHSKANMGNVGEFIKTELSSAINIKSKPVRNAVQAALRACYQAVKTFKGASAPENGLVLCAGETLYCV
jgi:peptide subunit release factor 1 (eRF1)